MNYSDRPEAVSRAGDRPEAVSRAEYGAMTPLQQGIVSYFQGYWNKTIPEKCPYELGTRAHREWNEGQQRAVILAQDSEVE